MKKAEFKPLTSFSELSPDEMIKRSKAFYDKIKLRRTVREYDTREAPQEVIENALLAAGTAPNGANLQPWHCLCHAVEQFPWQCHSAKPALSLVGPSFAAKASQSWR